MCTYNLHVIVLRIEVTNHCGALILSVYISTFMMMPQSDIKIANNPSLRNYYFIAADYVRIFWQGFHSATKCKHHHS